MSKDRESKTFSSFADLLKHRQEQEQLHQSEEHQQAIQRALEIATGSAVEAVAMLDKHDLQQATREERLRYGKCYAEAGKQHVAQGNTASASARIAKAISLGYKPWHVQKRLELVRQSNRNQLQPRLPEEWMSRFSLPCGNCEHVDPAPLDCARCRGILQPPGLPIYKAHLSDLYALGVYRWQGDPDSFNALSRAIRWMKGNAGKDICKYLAFLLVCGLLEDTEFLSQADLIVPIPADPARARERGFDNIAELAVSVEAFSLVPLARHVLVKTRATPDLRALSPADRPVAIADSMAVSAGKRENVGGAVVLLLDDVVTSGSTLDLAARLLKEAGARDVLGAVLARSESSQASERIHGLD